MLEETVDVAGFDLLWRNKPELPVANEENRKLEEQLKLKKIEMEKLKVMLESNITKGKNIRDHFNELCQTVSFKQQLYKSKVHEFELESHAEKLIERETSRMEQEIGALKNEINVLNQRQKLREVAIAEQMSRREKVKAMIQWDEEALLQHLEESAHMEQDNLALLKYSSEDDSRISMLETSTQRLSKECFERKAALEDANTEVIIVQTELDRIQDEFQHAFKERNELIYNWEKVINQIQQRNNDIKKLSEHVSELQKEEVNLQRTLKEQKYLLSIEIGHNSQLERTIAEKDNINTKLRNLIKASNVKEEDLKAELSTVRGALQNLLYTKQTTENSIKQLDYQIQQKMEMITETQKSNEKMEEEINKMSQETLEADQWGQELEKVLERENARSIQLQKQLDSIVKDIMHYSCEIKDLEQKERYMENTIKNCEADVRNLTFKTVNIDNLRIKQESEMYEVESALEKVKNRLNKMQGQTNEEERRRVEKERSTLVAELEEKQKALQMLTEELKLMSDNLYHSGKEFERNKKVNLELTEKIQFLDFYIGNSQKTYNSCISRKQELLVQECLVRLQMKKFRKMLRNRNCSVASLQREKMEYETIMKERIEELKNCLSMLEAEIRAEEEEYSSAKRKFYESNDKITKLQNRYKIVVDTFGIHEFGDDIEIELILKAENEKRDLMFKRDSMISKVLRNDEELSALKNTVWLINAANEQFRQAIFPPGVNPEEGAALKRAELEQQLLEIQLHAQSTKLRALREALAAEGERLERARDGEAALQEALADRRAEREAVDKELEELAVKGRRADRSNSRLGLDVNNKAEGMGEDIRIHLLREIRRTASDLLCAAIETYPDIAAKVQELLEQAQVPLPARARSSLSHRSGSVSSFQSSQSLSARSSRTEITPSVVTLEMPD